MHSSACTRLHRWSINFSSYDGLVQPFPEPKLTKFYDNTQCHLVTITSPCWENDGLLSNLPFRTTMKQISKLDKQGKSEGFESCDRPIVRKRPIWVKISDVLYRVTLKFDGWPWKTIGHLSFAVSSFVQHFIAIGEFKLELQSGNAQFGSKSTIFEPCDLAIWRMTLKNNRAPVVFYFKLCASFCNHWCIETWVTVRKRQIWVKFDDFLSGVTLKFDGWP